MVLESNSLERERFRNTREKLIKKKKTQDKSGKYIGKIIW